MNQTVAFLEILTLNKAQMAQAMASFPSILGVSIEDSLKPTVRWFAEQSTDCQGSGLLSAIGWLQHPRKHFT